MTMNEVLIDRIADGTAVLLSADQICTRLDVSRSTFDRWVRAGAPLIEQLKNRQHGTYADRLNELEEGRITFPPPDIRIGNSPRWEMATFKKWLTKNLVMAAKNTD